MNTQTRKQPPALYEGGSLVVEFASRYGVDPNKLLPTLKATVFRGKDGAGVSDEQMLMLLVVANQHRLNPFTREIYAFPDKNDGIVPVVSIDGWMRIINEHPQFNGFEIRQAEETDGESWEPVDERAQRCPPWMEVTIFRKDREHGHPIREYLDECYKPAHKLPPKDGKPEFFIDGPWQTHTKRMLRHKTLIQGARIVFSFAGIFDEDEAMRIIDADTGAIVDADYSEVKEPPHTGYQPQTQTDRVKQALGDPPPDTE